MKINVKFLASTLLIAGFMSCNSAGKKSPEISVEQTKPKNFERVAPPTMMTDPQERANFVLLHYWDNFNFKDTMYCHAPEITEQALSDFFYIFPYASYNNVCESAKKLMKSAEADSVMYAYFCNKVEHYLYDPNSQMRNDEYYIPFLEQMISSQRLDDAHKIRPRHQLELTYKNRIGAKAENFVYNMASGKTGNLYSISAENLLIMFYNPGCHECRNTMEMLKNSVEISSAIKSGHLKILAVYPDENLAEWKNHIKEIPTSWINGYDKSTDLKDKEIYDLKAIPTLYLLDKEKKVILKDTSVDDINQYLKKK